jgi:ATP-dependent Lhr-like helicase
VSAFDRLTPALQYQIANGLGWSELRPVQELAIEAIVDGQNCVVLAPTAGGKTEAAFFPLLSLMDAEDRSPVSTLYVAPIRALLNNQEERLEKLTALVGRRAFKWHGDVGQSARRRFLQDPADVLAITPESLEAMLIGAKVPVRRLFAGLQAVVIDEVHSFADGDRGGHLMAVLERLSRFSQHDVQRIGLSATVGNPEHIGRWMQGSSRRPTVVIDPPRTAAQPELSLDYVGALENAAVVIEALHRGRKRLVFADSRRVTEELAHHLGARDVDVHVSHSSLSVSERGAAERAFAEGQNCVIVATSALELGIDVGDLDHVLQIDCPSTVSSFLQRMGRTGRRADTRANCTFLALKQQKLIQAAALLRLQAQGYVEPVEPSMQAHHLLGHQLMALTLQETGAPTADWWAWVRAATPFSEITEADRQELLDHMLAQNIVVEADARLILGEQGEKLYGRRHFMDLYVVFSTPRVFRVMWGPTEVGTVDSFFIEQRDEGQLAFVLAGKPWQVTHIDWRRGICAVEPAPRGKFPRWTGEPVLLSWDLCQAMREVLTDDSEDPWWSKRARETLRQAREEYTFLHDDPLPMTEDASTVRWWTFAGGKANNLLAVLLERELGGKVTPNNLALSFSEEAGKSSAAIRKAIRTLRESGDVQVPESAAAPKRRLSKFEPCLPPAQLRRLGNLALFDCAAARRALGLEEQS